MEQGGFFDPRRAEAGPAFSRWLVPPAALSIHLCIGQAYAFSVFNKPLSTLRGVTGAAPDDWTIPQIGWVFSLAIICLGLSAALFGRWVEAGGPRRAMFASACCFGGGFLVAAGGVHLHQIALLYLGYGVIGGVGLGLGYISPVSTLIKWFPDRPGLATGLAIMGFGGGAMIGAPLAVGLMNWFRTPADTGVWQAMACMGAIYFAVMMFGVLTVRTPPPNWRPAGFVLAAGTGRLVTAADVAVGEAIRTRQFWLLWAVLCLNVTAGIGVLGQASLMIQETFPGRVTAAAAAGFVGLLSLFNMAGRFFWSTLSDKIGRRVTFAVFFALGAVLYAAVPSAAHLGGVGLFVAGYALIISMYGGGFATIPAYLRDLFGTLNVGAIHGRLLTAWAVAGGLGPTLLNQLRDDQIARGVARADAYSLTLYIMAGLLTIGFLCNLAMSPVDARHHLNAPPAPATA